MMVYAYVARNLFYCYFPLQQYLCFIVPIDTRYKKMEPCVTPYPEVSSPDEVAGGALKAFPERLNMVPPRIVSGSVPGISVESYNEDNSLWKQHIKAYKSVNKLLDTGRYRNIMDMNAGLGSFAAAIESPKLWVMNVVPTIAEKSTLGVIYERGLIGIYHDWYVCILVLDIQLFFLTVKSISETIFMH